MNLLLDQIAPRVGRTMVVHYNTVKPYYSRGYSPLSPEAWLRNNMRLEKWKLLRASHLSPRRLSELLHSCVRLTLPTLRFCKLF